MKPIKPEELGFSESDGAVSINADAVAKRLNQLLEQIEVLQRRSWRCQCMNCIVIGGCP